jgi:hypothetical protein
MRTLAHRLGVVVGIWLAAFGGDLRAVDIDIGPEVIDEAIVFARQATRSDREAYHLPYLRTPGETVRRISIVTEYRRVVLRVEEHRRLLSRNYGVRQMTGELKPWRGLVEIIVELQFHPQNTYVQVPLIDVLLVPLDEARALPLVAESTDRQPQFGTFWAPLPPEAPWWPFPPPNAPVLAGTEPLTGGWVHARFDAAPLVRGRYDVVVKDGGATLGMGAFDFGALR